MVARLRESLGLGEPFSDPGVSMFGLRNAVFAIGDTFLEVVSPVEEGTSAGRLLDRRGGDCGYMVMFQVPDLPAAKERAAAQSVREVFDVDLPDISEVHLHPADMSGAIVSLSAPIPPQSWRWGGPEWKARSVPGQVNAVTVAVADPEAVAARWDAVVGTTDQARFVRDSEERGPTEIELALVDHAEPLTIGSVRIAVSALQPS